MSVGGGALGLAESAAAMMAGPLGPAAQIAEQEMNLAMQKGSQLAATAAMAPLETTWLGGGQMGAPALSGSPWGWAGKLSGGVIGQTVSMPNSAGAVQPPKKPNEQKQGEDPGNGAPPDGPAGPRMTRCMSTSLTRPQPRRRVPRRMRRTSVPSQASRRCKGGGPLRRDRLEFL